jgi:hypothetical protein
MQAETLAAGVIVGLMGEDEQNKDPSLSNTDQAAPIEDFPDSSEDPDDTIAIKSKICLVVCGQFFLLILSPLYYEIARREIFESF